jgi:hypothetical protein
VKGGPVELSPVHRVVVFIAGAVFLTMGIGLSIGFIKESLYGYWRTRAEVTAEARLVFVEWRYHSSGRGGGSASTEVSYGYQVGDKWFTGARVTLFKPTRRYFRPLKRAMDESRPIRVFIDPVHPQFAVIDRDFALFPLVIAVPFSLAFTGAGLFLEWCLWMNLQGKAVPARPPYVPPKRASRAERRRAARGAAEGLTFFRFAGSSDIGGIASPPR